MPQNTDNEIIIDFNKFLKTLIENKKIIFTCFFISMSLGILLNFSLPKKYTSESKILIKKSGSTNLSYINPFIISEDNENNYYNEISSGQNSLSEEIEIIKSPLIIDTVTKENNLKYKNGPAKGKYLSSKDFLKKDFNISKLKDANIIYIAYKSTNPLLSYNVVNSIVNNYKKIQQNINLEKSLEDTKFLKKECLKTEKELNLKIKQLKTYKHQPENLIPNANLLIFFDKRIEEKLNQISNNETDFKKLELEITQKTEELNSLKQKLEWSLMVKEISKKTTDIIILQSPEIKEKYDFSEPQPVIIFILSLFSWIFSSLIFIKIKL